MPKHWIAWLIGLASVAVVGYGITILMAVRTPRAQLTVVLTEYGIDVSRVPVRRGDLVQLTVINSGKEVHELVVEEYGLELEGIRPGQVKHLSFRARRAGVIRLACHLPGHYDKGMWAEIEVSE